MSLPLHHFPYQDSKPSSRNLYPFDAQISPCFNEPDFRDQSQHPPYVPQWLAPGPAPVMDVSDDGIDLQWNSGFEPKKKWFRDMDFLGNCSQPSSVDFLGTRSVSTGLGLSLDQGGGASGVEFAFSPLVGVDALSQELRRQDAEMERYLKVQGDLLRQAILEKVYANQLQTITNVEDKVLQKLREKEVELENINRKNMDLEQQIQFLSAEAESWQQRAIYYENMIAALKLNIQQIYARTLDGKEGCGDSEVDDTASCCNGRVIDFHLLCKEDNGKKESIMCRACNGNKACMLLLPCKHLCLCKDCESRLSLCPLCQSSKLIGMEVYTSCIMEEEL